MNYKNLSTEMLLDVRMNHDCHASQEDGCQTCVNVEQELNKREVAAKQLQEVL